MKKTRFMIAMILAATLSITSVCPALAAEDAKGASVDETETVETETNAEEAPKAAAQEQGTEAEEEKTSESKESDVQKEQSEPSSSGECGDQLSWYLEDENTLNIEGTGKMTDYSQDDPAPWYPLRDKIERVFLSEEVESIGEYAFKDCGELKEIHIKSPDVLMPDTALDGCSADVQIINDAIDTETTEEEVVSADPDEAESDADSEVKSDEDPIVTEDAEAVSGETDQETLTDQQDLTNQQEIEEESTEVIDQQDTQYDQTDETADRDADAAEDHDGITDDLETTEGVQEVNGEEQNQDDPAVPALNQDNSLDQSEKDSLTQDAPVGFEEIQEEVLEKELPQKKAKADSATSGKCGSNATWKLEGGVLTISGTGAISDYDEEYAPWYDIRDSITSVVINSGITRIGNEAFVQCYQIESVSIPDTVSEIGSGAFVYCSSLTSITLPNAVKILSSGVFAYCSSLNTLSMPGVTTIENYALQDTSIDTIMIGKNLREMSELALFGTRVSAYQVEAGNPVYSARDGVLFSADGSKLIAYPPYNERSSYTIPSGVRVVGNAAFAKNSYLSSITISNGVTTLEDSAFQEMQGITSIAIPDSVTSAGMFVFYGCSSLQSVSFGKGLAVTGYEMFENCSQLRTISFGGLRELESRTFAFCESLTDVSLPAAITEIGSGAFGECTSLRSFASAGLSEIPFQAFLNDYNLTSVSLNQGVTHIYRMSFMGCDSLSSITLPSSVVYVDSNAFPKNTIVTVQNSSLSKYGKNGYRVQDSVTVTGTRNYDHAYSVLNLVNAERRKNGLTELKMESSLLETAMVRASETAVLFSHTRPDGSSCMDLNDLMCAENIAAGQSSPAAAMTSWMNSQGHRENILDESFRSIGIGCVQVNGCYYWVQCFSREEITQNCAKPANRNTTQNVSFAIGTFDEAAITSGIIWGSVDEYTYSVEIDGAGNLETGQTLQLTAYLKNSGMFINFALTGRNVKYSSSNPSIASVNGNGKVTALSAGTARITAATANGRLSNSVTIKVKKAVNTIKASNVYLTKSPKVQTKKLRASNTRKLKMTYKSDNKKVKVNKSGKITVAKNYVGVAHITISTPKSGHIPAAKKKITVTVRPYTPKVSTTKKGSNKVKVQWEKIQKISGYQIQYANKKNMKGAKRVTVKKTATFRTIKRLKKNKKMFIRVRSWQKVKGRKVYSKWSKIIRI